MKGWRLFGKELWLSFCELALSIHSLFEFDSAKSAHLVLLDLTDELDEQGVLDEMRLLESKGYKPQIMANMLLRNICLERVDRMWEEERLEQPKPQWICLAYF